MISLNVRLGDGLKFTEDNKITTNWNVDKIGDSDIKQPDGLYIPSMKGSDGSDGTGSVVDDYTLKEEHNEYNLDDGITKSLMEVADALNNTGANVRLRDVVELIFRDGSNKSDFDVNAYWIFSLAIRRMGYEFNQDGTQENLNSNDLLEATTQNFIYDKSGNLSKDWEYIDYNEEDIREGDILVSEILTYTVEGRHRHLAMFINKNNDKLYGFDFSNDDKLHAAMRHSKERFDNEDWKDSLNNDINSKLSLNSDEYEKVIRYVPSETFVVPNHEVVVPIYSMAAWTTDQANRQSGYIPYTNPKHAKKKQNIINEVNYLYDKGIGVTSYIIKPNSLLQFVVIGNDANDGFTHTLSSNGYFMEDMNRYPDEKTVALFWVKSVTNRGDYTGAISDIELVCLWSHNHNWWVPGENWEVNNN